MKIPFTEIWPFLRLMKGEEHVWQFRLVAGEFAWDAGYYRLVQQLENDTNYDPELLPNLFTFREIFWQPNVYPTLNACLTSLKLVANFGEELIHTNEQADDEIQQLYAALVDFIGKLALSSHEMLAASGQPNEQIASVLGEFRKRSFPVIMLFIQHPMNRAGYREDALRRVNFMVKTLLDQYQLRFNDLLMPYWNVEKKTEHQGSGETSAATDTGSPV